MDERFSQLNEWLATLGFKGYEIAPASADASFRRYFRVAVDNQSFIVMDAPPQQEDTGPYIQVAELLFGLGLHVPQIIDKDTRRGFLLLSDLGSRMYLPELNTASVSSLYADAMAALLTMQQCQQADLPAYDFELLMTEMGLFRDWYLQQHLGLTLSTEQHAVLQGSFELLAATALQQPKVVVHRDYHSRNLMVADPNPGILDFQDAVIGPVTYDLVSLLRDCYIAWPRQQVEAWAEEYYQQAQQAGILAEVSWSQFMHWFDWMGIQRHLKASGIFARLNHRDHKPGYLKDIPRTLGYVIEVAANYAELAPFMNLLDETGVIKKLSEQQNSGKEQIA